VNFSSERLLDSSRLTHTANMRGPGKHQKRLSAPSHWLLDKLSGSYAPKASPGPHKLRDCMPLIVFIRNRYAQKNHKDLERRRKREGTRANVNFLAV
jgi:hypothetical protein